MHLTVAICTWNRANLLDQTLNQMHNLRIPAGVTWELLVVNNNSTDQTDEVISRHAARLPLRGLFEARPGKSNALNLATREAAGKYIMWTDDDVLVDPEWLAAFHAAFLRWPEAAVFGGTIEPLFAGSQPRWFQRAWPEVACAYATITLQGKPTPMAPHFPPNGANMAVQTQRQREFLYDPNIGPQPGSTIRGEESVLVSTMLARGLTGWWVPDARVRHYIPEDRQTIQYLRGYFAGYGEFLAMNTPEKDAPRWFGIPRWVWRRLLTTELKYGLRRLFSRPERWIEDLRNSSIARGLLRGYAHPRNAGLRAPVAAQEAHS